MKRIAATLAAILPLVARRRPRIRVGSGDDASGPRRAGGARFAPAQAARHARLRRRPVRAAHVPPADAPALIDDLQAALADPRLGARRARPPDGARVDRAPARRSPTFRRSSARITSTIRRPSAAGSAPTRGVFAGFSDRIREVDRPREAARARRARGRLGHREGQPVQPRPASSTSTARRSPARRRASARGTWPARSSRPAR